MKKFMTIMLCVLLVGTLFVSCGKKASTTETEVAATPATTAPAAATPAPATKAAEPVAKTAEPAAKPAATTATEAPAATASPKTEGTNVAAQPAKNANEIVFRIANGAEPESLDPALIQGVPEHRIYEGLFEGLVANDPKDASPVPGVAESWSSNEDGTVWTFKIRKDAKWSDGVPITAHDVVYSWLRELDPATASPYAWFPCMFVKGANEYNSGKAGKDAVAIKALDDYTFQMELLGPLPYAIGALTHYSFAIVPEH
ncbi:MAG: ABC transporter substrate-binding protein, partial [Sphaerochaetaceae bacterium]